MDGIENKEPNQPPATPPNKEVKFLTRDEALALYKEQGFSDAQIAKLEAIVGKVNIDPNDPRIAPFIEERAKEKDKVTKAQLYDSMEHLKKQNEELANRLKAIEAESQAKIAEAKKKLEDEEKTKLTVEQKLAITNSEFEKKLTEVQTESQKQISELQNFLKASKLQKLRDELVAEANGELVTALIPDPEENYMKTGVLMTETDLKLSIEVAKAEFQKVKDLINAKSFSSSKTFGAPTGRIGEQPVMPKSVALNPGDYQKMTPAERQAYKDKLLADAGF